MRTNISLKVYDKVIDELLRMIQSQLNFADVLFRVSLVDYVQFGGTKCNGYFNDLTEGFNGPTLAISVGKPVEKWLPTLLHEFCHFKQWYYEDPLWMNLRKNNIQEEDLLFDWINGKEFPDGFITELMPRVRDMELDCEKRVIELVNKRPTLPINPAEYTKNANAYINFYTYMAMKRKWYVIGKEPYNNPEIIKLMSDKFDMDYDNLSPDLIALYDECVKE